MITKVGKKPLASVDFPGRVQLPRIGDIVADMDWESDDDDEIPLASMSIFSRRIGYIEADMDWESDHDDEIPLASMTQFSHKIIGESADISLLHVSDALAVSPSSSDSSLETEGSIEIHYRTSLLVHTEPNLLTG